MAILTINDDDAYTNAIVKACKGMANLHSLRTEANTDGIGQYGLNFLANIIQNIHHVKCIDIW